MLRKIASVFVNNMMVYVLSLVYTVLTARLLGPEQRGLLVVSVLVPTWLATLSQIGLPQSLVYNLSRLDRATDALAGAVAVSVRTAILGILLSTLAYAVLVHTPVLKGIYPSLALVSLMLCLSLIAEAIAGNILAGLQDFPSRNVVNVIRPLLLALGLFWFWLRSRGFVQGLAGSGLGPHLLTPVEAVGLQVIGSVCAAVVGFAYIRVRHGGRFAFRLPVRWHADYLVYGLKFYLATVANAINYRLDTLMVNAWLDSRQVGLYSIAVGACEFLLFVPVSVTFVFFPKIASVDERRRDRMTLLTLGLSLYVVAIGAGIMNIAVPKLIVLVFGSAFAGGIPAAHWLLPGMVALTVVRILSYSSAGQGRPEHATYATIVGLGGTIPLDIILIPRMGIVGAAIASTIAYTLSAITVLFLHMKLRKLSLRTVLLGTLVEPLIWARNVACRRAPPTDGDLMWVRNPNFGGDEASEPDLPLVR